MDNNILNSNKIPGSPGCDSFTRPEEIAALSKFLGTVRKIQEENTQLDNGLEPIPGITTGKFPIIDKLPDSVDNIDLSREEISLSDKIISLDKISSILNQEINNLPDVLLRLEQKVDIDSLGDDLLKLTTKDDNLALEDYKEDLLVSENIKLGNTLDKIKNTSEVKSLDDSIEKLKTDSKNEINELSYFKETIKDNSKISKLNSDRIDLNVENNINLKDSVVRLDIDSSIDKKLELNNELLSIETNEDDINLDDTIINLNTASNIELENTLIDLEADKEVKLVNELLKLDHNNNSVLEEKRIDLNHNEDINLENTKLVIEDSSKIELEKDILLIKHKEDTELSTIKLTIDHDDNVSLSDKLLKLKQENADTELEDTIIGLDSTEEEIKLGDLLLGIEKINEELSLGETVLNLEKEDKDLELDDLILSLEDDSNTELSNTRVSLDNNDKNVSLNNTVLRLDYDNNIELGNTLLNLEQEDENIVLNESTVNIQVTEDSIELSNVSIALETDEKISLIDYLDEIKIEKEIDSLENTKIKLSSSISPENDSKHDWINNNINSSTSFNLNEEKEILQKAIGPDNQGNYSYLDNSENSKINKSILNVKSINIGSAINPENQGDYEYLDNTKDSSITEDILNVDSLELGSAVKPNNQTNYKYLDNTEDSSIITKDILNVKSINIGSAISPEDQGDYEYLDNTKDSSITEDILNVDSLELGDAIKPNNQSNYKYIDNTEDSSITKDILNTENINIGNAINPENQRDYKYLDNTKDSSITEDILNVDSLELGDAIKPNNQSNYKYIDNTEDSSITKDILNTGYINLGSVYCPINQTDYNYISGTSYDEPELYELSGMENIPVSRRDGKPHNWFNNISGNNESSKLNSTVSTNINLNDDGVTDYDSLVNYNRTKSLSSGSFGLPEDEDTETKTEYDKVQLKFGTDTVRDTSRGDIHVADDYEDLLSFNKKRALSNDDSFTRPIPRDTNISNDTSRVYTPLENNLLLHEKTDSGGYKRQEYLDKLKSGLLSNDELFELIMGFDEYIWSSSDEGKSVLSTGYETPEEISVPHSKESSTAVSTKYGSKMEWIAKIKTLVCAYLSVSPPALSDNERRAINQSGSNVDDFIDKVNATVKNAFALVNIPPDNIENNKIKTGYNNLNINEDTVDKNNNLISDDYDALLNFNKDRSLNSGDNDDVNVFSMPEDSFPETNSSIKGDLNSMLDTEVTMKAKRTFNNGSWRFDKTMVADSEDGYEELLKFNEERARLKELGRGWYKYTIPSYKLPGQNFALDKNYSITNYLRYAAETLFANWSRDLKVGKKSLDLRKVLLEETLALLIWGRDELEVLAKANKYRLPGDDYGLLSNLASGASMKEVAKGVVDSIADAVSIDLTNPINRPLQLSKKDKEEGKLRQTFGWEEANNRPSVVPKNNQAEDESFWKKLGNELIGSGSTDNRKYNFLDQYLTSEGIKTTLYEFTGHSLMESNGTVENFYELLKNSPYFTTSSKITTTENGYKVITLDSNMHWEVIFEPYIGSLNGDYTFLPPIKEINLRNKELHGVETAYSYWIPINSFELQKEKLSTKSLGLFDGEIVYPTSMEFTNEFRMTIVDDQYKSWRNYFERCAQASVFNSSPVIEGGVFTGFEKNGMTREERNKYGVLISSSIVDKEEANPDSSVIIDRNYHLVSPYKNITFRCRIFVMTPQLSTINKYDLLLVLKEMSEERSGEIDSSGTDLTLSFSIVGENPPATEETTDVKSILTSNADNASKHRSSTKEKSNLTADLITGIGNTVIEILG